MTIIDYLYYTIAIILISWVYAMLLYAVVLSYRGFIKIFKKDF